MKNVVFIKNFEDNQEINKTIYWSYKKSKESGNELIDFSGTVWAREIPEIAETLRSAGVKEFTISQQASNLLENMAAFTKCGFNVSGIAEINSTYRNYETNEFEIIPAVLMKSE
ncbi:MAG: hypothetical protein IJT21_04645 [Synergistaceae bacterium]|nr:hypothetical protein [Synergistaceae bacterium]